MHDYFQLAAGTIPGRRHVGSGNLLVGKNNQDAYGVSAGESCLVAAVFDGCSSSSHAEVGAKIAAHVVPHAVRQAAEEALPDCEKLTSPEFWQTVKLSILCRLTVIAAAMSPSCSVDQKVVEDLFLFTIVGAVITKNCTVVFSIGDGMYATDGIMHRIGPFANNAPPYIAYELLPQFRGNISFRVHAVQFGTYDSLLLATDGFGDLLDRGHHQRVAPISQLWTNDMFFCDQQGCCESITPWLRRLNSEIVRVHQTNGTAALQREYGLLNDDTTVVSIRRKRGIVS